MPELVDSRVFTAEEWETYVDTATVGDHWYSDTVRCAQIIIRFTPGGKRLLGMVPPTVEPLSALRLLFTAGVSHGVIDDDERPVEFMYAADHVPLLEATPVPVGTMSWEWQRQIAKAVIPDTGQDRND
jgi:hypothetical protein